MWPGYTFIVFSTSPKELFLNFTTNELILYFLELFTELGLFLYFNRGSNNYIPFI